ncbi:MAG TPA: ABC transporter ATP-binding protein [Caproicibacter sp.]|nr:ABC transporter ATP-binding protein [Caproicibacter sp.]
MIEFVNVVKKFGPAKTASDNVSLTVNDGEVFGFLGPNGAGKTTAIKMMTGILKPDSGVIRMNGSDVQQNPIEAKKQFGYVPDSPDFFLRLKGIEYLNFMADIYEVPADIRMGKIKNLVSKFEMEDALSDSIQSYSHGMRQKIVIIGALLHDPAIWILDEPMTGLDPKSAYTLKQMMREHADAGKTVFFSTHILEVAEELCDRVAIINRGKMLFAGSIQELKDRFKANESLEKIFLEITENE